MNEAAVEKPGSETPRDWKIRAKLLAANLFLALSVLICGPIILWSPWPAGSSASAVGQLAAFAMMLCFFLSLFLLASLYFFRKLINPDSQDNPTKANRPKRRLLAAGLIILISIIGVGFLRLPFRAAFYLCRSSFEEVAEEDPPEEYGFAYAFRDVGIWDDVHYAKDVRGGAYFNIACGSSSAGWTCVGFVRNPNSKGSPFGDMHYDLVPLGGEWYYFEESSAESD